VRQLRGKDRLGRGAAVKSHASENLRARTADADQVVKSACPYCAVGCAQNVFVNGGRVVQIGGDPDAPHSRGRLCAKGAATLQLTTGDAREQHVLYRRSHGTEWERADLETAMEMVADRFVATRREGWEWERDGRRTRRCISIATLGGATLDNEERARNPRSACLAEA
jgi:formate dehydrogenase major subunit